MKLQKAVQFARAMRHMELKLADKMTARDKQLLTQTKLTIAPELRRHGVGIPDDLSFAQ